MAATVTTSGIESLEKMLQQMGDKAQDIAAEALYDGADVMADAYKRAAGSVRAKKRQHFEPDGQDPSKARYPTPAEKEVLKKIGVANFQKDMDSVNTIVGPAKGYVTINGQKKAIQLIARAVNSGTSFMKKQPVFRQAVSRNRKTAQAKIVSTAEGLINDIINGKTTQGGK